MTFYVLHWYAMTFDIWHLTSGILHLTFDIWHDTFQWASCDAKNLARGFISNKSLAGGFFYFKNLLQEAREECFPLCDVWAQWAGKRERAKRFQIQFAHFSSVQSAPGQKISYFSFLLSTFPLSSNLDKNGPISAAVTWPRPPWHWVDRGAGVGHSDQRFCQVSDLPPESLAEIQIWTKKMSLKMHI